MALFVSDSFTGTAAQDLGVYNPNWVMVTGLTGVAALSSTGTRVRQTATGGTAGYYRSDAAPASADYSVIGDIYVASATGTGSGGITGRVSSTAQTLYHARVTNGTGIQLVRYIAGTATTLATSAMTFVDGQTVRLRLEMIGSTISVYVDNAATPAISVVDTNITAAGFAGIRFLNVSSAQIQIDEFSADQAAAGASGTLSSTLANSSVSASGQIINAGSFSSALSGGTMSASGSVAGAPSGGFSSTLSGSAMSASGIQLNPGSFGAAMQALSMNAAGTVANHASGTMAATMGGATMNAAGNYGAMAAITYLAISRYRQRRPGRRHFTY